jgi:hypothetical protein
MKKTIIACLLAASCSSALAEWTRYGQTDDTIFYIDLKTIRKDANLRKVWLIHDLKQLGKQGGNVPSHEG